MKRIFHIITTIENGGAEKQLLVLASEQIVLGHMVEIIPLKGKLELKEKLISQGANVNTILLNKNPLVQSILIKFYFRKSNPDTDIIHAHLPRAELISAFANKHLKFFITRHNSELFLPGGPRFISNILSKLVISRSNKCIAISKAVAEFLIASNEIFDGGKIEIVHYGFMPDDIKSAEYSYKENFIIGTISRLEPQKDVYTLLNAFAEFIKVKENGLLFIIGDGSMRLELEKHCNQIGISNKVTWVGKVQNVHAYLQRFNLFVLSTNYEGFGLVLLEAMQHGLPILASNNSAIPEVLGETSYSLFETGNSRILANKMLDLTEEKFRIKLAEENKARLAKFEPSVMAMKIMNIYEH